MAAELGVEDVKTSSTSRGSVKLPWEPRAFTESVCRRVKLRRDRELNQICEF